MYLDTDGNVVKGAEHQRPPRRRRAGHRRPASRRRCAKYGTMKRADADRAGDPPAPSRASCSSRATSTCWPPPPTTSARTRRRRRSSSTRASRSRSAADAGAEGPGADAAGRSPRPARTASTRARSARRSSPRARPARASSRRPTSTSTQTRELAPVECDYRGYRIVSAPPPSSGGVDHLRDAQHPRGLSAEGAGLPLGRRRCTARSRRCATPTSTATATSATRTSSKNPVDRLLDKAYAAKIRAAIDPAKAGDARSDLKPGVAPHEGSNTTHYSIVDKRGNAVSVTYTLNDWFGAKVTAAGTGVLLNNEMDDFTVEARRAQPVRPGAGRGERHRAGQAAAELDEPDHRHARTASR